MGGIGITSRTRGWGLLENSLAAWRGRVARRHLPASVRTGRILDIGCGWNGWFLDTVVAAEKEGLDRLCETATPAGSAGADGGAAKRLRSFDVAQGALPYASDWFDAVVMLAVLEHLPRASTEALLREVRRVLKPDGRCVVTTPSRGTEALLHGLARIGLVSVEEIEEHQQHFTPRQLREAFLRAGFAEAAIRQGQFEFGANLWLVASKEMSLRDS